MTMNKFSSINYGRIMCFGLLIILGVTQVVHCVAGPGAPRKFDTDVCVYGGTSGGVIAAVEAARQGKSVALVAVNNHLGGMTSGGLGETDIGRFGNGFIQGLAREFYERVGRKYGTGAKFTFEPHVAEEVFNEMAEQAGVRVFTNQSLASVRMRGTQLIELHMEGGDIFAARMFIDASYEGDLMAKAGVSFTIGREAKEKYGESLNGVRRPNTGGHQFGNLSISPYVVSNEPSSGLLPLIQTGSPGAPGTGDRRVQAYNFRLCLTRTATNQIPISSPPGYEPARYELLARYIGAMKSRGSALTLGSFMNISPMPNDKTDINNNGPISTDFIGESEGYTEANSTTRALIWQAHRSYTQGLLYFLATDARVPPGVRAQMRSYGFCKDEFVDNGGWPWQLYVREARRMVSDYVMTESNCLGQVVAADSIGLAAYNMDSHNCERVVVNGVVRNEGDVEEGCAGPYPISYRSIVPRVGECGNLLVPWCLSASHIGFGSIRMEPVFLILGQSAGAAACLALDEHTSVQQVDMTALQARLAAEKQLLHWGGTVSGDVLDNASSHGVTIVGAWTHSDSVAGYYGPDYLTDGNTNKGQSSVTFAPNLPQAGRYKVYARWTAHPNRASDVPFDVIHPGGTTTVQVDETQRGGQWVLLLVTNFEAGTAGKVRIRNSGTSGYVIADAVRFVRDERPGTEVRAR